MCVGQTHERLALFVFISLFYFAFRKDSMLIERFNAYCWLKKGGYDDD
jgi:hypothetical protein